MHFSKLFFSYNDGQFSHNLKDDYALFAIWKSARPFRDEIINILEEKFEILLVKQIEWSEKNFAFNAARLYKEPHFLDKKNDDSKHNHLKKIGDYTFTVIVIKDTKPQYTYAMSVSNAIEISNMNIVSTKYAIRDLVFAKQGTKYAVHSTNSIIEFFQQAPNLFGINTFDDIFSSPLNLNEVGTKDMVGANGWNSWSDLFETLNRSCNYLVLRGFEDLPEKNEELDLDLLTDDFQLLASLLGVQQLSEKPYKGFIYVQGTKVSIDIRFVGDNYYDSSWSKDMLSSKILHNDVVYIPRDDHYFFSLLFHAKVQKREVKDKYVIIFEKLAKKLDFNWFSISMLEDNKIIGKILDGYFRSSKYFYQNPIDPGVYKNLHVIKYLPTPNVFKIQESNKKIIKRKIKKVLPQFILKRITK